MQLARRFLYLALIAFLGGCADGPSSAPSVEELAGSYRLDKESQVFLRDKRGYNSIPLSILRLHRDGSVAATSIPDAYLDGYGKGSGHFVSGVGRWNVEKTSFGYGVTLEIARGGSMPPGIYHASSIHLRGQRAPYRIEMLLGDPDSRETLTYERYEG
jgi:hypothetical protein